MICKICQKEYQPQHFNQKLCSLECKSEAAKERNRKYKKSEKGKEAYIRWCKNPVKKIIDKKYRQTDKAKKAAVERTNRFYKRHPDIKRYRDRLYGYSRRGYNAGKFSKKEWDEKLEKCGGLCQICKTDKDITIDHIIPLSKGGKNDINNLQPLCRSCNSKKYNTYE